MRDSNENRGERIIFEERVGDLLVKETYEYDGQIGIRNRFDPSDEYEKKDVIKLGLMNVYDRTRTALPSSPDYDMLFDNWWSSVVPSPLEMDGKEREKSFKEFIDDYQVTIAPPNSPDKQKPEPEPEPGPEM